MTRSHIYTGTNMISVSCQVPSSCLLYSWKAGYSEVWVMGVALSPTVWGEQGYMAGVRDCGKVALGPALG